MKNLKNSLLKLMAILLVVGVVMGITNFAMLPAYAETHEDLAKIFLTRQELADWEVTSPFYYTKSSSKTDISVGGQDGPTRTINTYVWTKDSSKTMKIEKFLTVMEECMKDLIMARTCDAAYARYMIEPATCSEARDLYYQDAIDIQDAE